MFTSKQVSDLVYNPAQRASPNCQLRVIVEVLWQIVFRWVSTRRRHRTFVVLRLRVAEGATIWRKVSAEAVTLLCFLFLSFEDVLLQHVVHFRNFDVLRRRHTSCSEGTDNGLR